jgi:hypothetical protein
MNTPEVKAAICNRWLRISFDSLRVGPSCFFSPNLGDVTLRDMSFGDVALRVIVLPGDLGASSPSLLPRFFDALPSMFPLLGLF